MSDEHSIVPVPTDKPSLAEYLDSLLPFRIPRLPLVRIAANLDMAAARLILAKTEQYSARIDAVTAKIRRRSNVEDRFLESAERIAEKALKQNEIPKGIAFAYLEAETEIKFSNRAKVLEQATKELEYNPPEQDAKEPIDEDWLNMFSHLAEQKSSEELQSLFGKILAGEIRQPGAISLRTLTVVSSLTSNEANTIVDAFRFVIGRGAIVSHDVAPGPTRHSTMLLEEMGVITGSGGLFAWGWKIAASSTTQIAGVTNGIQVKNLTDSELQIQIGALLLTEAGKQLYAIAKLNETPLEYLRATASAIANGTSSLGNRSPLKSKAEISLISLVDGSVSVREIVQSSE